MNHGENKLAVELSANACVCDQPGESAFTEKQISEAISGKVDTLPALEQKRDAVSITTDAIIHKIDELIAFKKSAISWKKEFERADTEKQKELMAWLLTKCILAVNRLILRLGMLRF